MGRPPLVYGGGRVSDPTSQRTFTVQGGEYVGEVVIWIDEGGLVVIQGNVPDGVLEMIGDKWPGTGHFCG